MQTDDYLSWTCQYCGEENVLWVDLTIEDEQDFIEDCSFCCRPNRIVISPIQEGEGLLVTAMLTDE